MDLSKELRTWSGSVLEVGAGAMPYRRMIPKACAYRALDWSGAGKYFSYHSPEVDYFNGRTFPYRKESFDRVLHVEVLEHVWDHRFFLEECRRVLKKGGRLFFTVPFAARWHYIPMDYWRYTRSALEKLCKESGFRDVRVKSRGTDLCVMLYKINSVMYRMIAPRTKGILSLAVSLAAGAVFLLPILFVTLCHWTVYALNWGSKDDPLGYSVQARK